MSGISRPQRRAVRRGGYEMFCQEKPSRRTKIRLVNFLALFMGLDLAREFGHGSTFSGWEPALSVTCNLNISGGWFPPVMRVLWREVRARRDVANSGWSKQVCE